MPIIIEVAVSDDISSTEKGRLLEDLGEQILKAQQYEVTSEVRLTGMEVDLLAKHKISGEEIFVECKAYREPFSADVITKLLGNVEFKSVSSGWLITTAQLNKDGKGLQSEWERKPPEEKRKLQFYTPERVVDLLVDNKIVCSPESLIYPNDNRYSEDKYLLLTNYGRFWAVPLINAEAGVPYAVILFDVQSGKSISNSNVVDNVSHTNSSLEEYEWLVSGHAPDSSRSSHLATESQNIVAVAPGDQWADYRPSRPEDFVGRKDLQRNIFQFLDKVRQGASSTKLLAIKSPSGWGKSSILLKLIDRCGNKRNKSKYFMYAVDTRSATSARYGELALVACLRAAIGAGFLPSTEEPVRLASAANPLSDSTVIPLLNYLRAEQKVIVLFFDQFEEIFSKKDLSSLFDNIRTLCSAVDSIQENIVIGFSWKTDGSVPADHPAYFMWHNLADRRHEFSLSPFSKLDISEALTLFSRELGSPLNPILKRQLADQCQGYPWLLKKLCIHVFDSVNQGIDQTQILGRSLNVKELFEKDESELTQSETTCLKHIATDSPAEFFHVQDVYGSETINSLINRRLVVRRGSRLTLYWDIFRDFVLTRNVPQIPITYIPTATFGRYNDALNIVLESGKTNVTDLASRLNLSESTTENIIADIVMVGDLLPKRVLILK